MTTTLQPLYNLSSVPTHNLPIVSFIIPAYNDADSLQGCIESIIMQSYPHVELIVIDGGSQDNTVELLQNYNEHITYWVSEPDGGICYAWNKGLEKATGEWIILIGCDDEFVSADSLSKMVDVALADDKIEYVSAQADMYDQNGDFLHTKGVAWEWDNFIIKRRSSIVHTSSMHRRSLFERYGNFDTTYRVAFDTEFLLRAGPTLNAGFLPEVTIRRGAGGNSNQFVLKGFLEVYRAHIESPHVKRWQATINLALGIFKYHGGRAKRALRQKFA